MLEKSITENYESEIASPLRIIDCGLADYKKVLELQYRLRDERRRGEISNTVLIVEHFPVITLGARKSANKLLVSTEDLAQKHINVVDIRRGGGTTAHNSGQLVFYPILYLQELGLGISEYIRELESIGAELLEQLGVHCHKGLSLGDEKEILRFAQNDRNGTKEQKRFPGLWVGTKKIASIGVRVSKFVTYHGMAINIQNDLSIFEFITPCGLDGVEMTSVLKESGKRHSMSQVKERLSQLLARHFS